jgi:hypothetical protein
MYKYKKNLAKTTGQNEMVKNKGQDRDSIRNTCVSRRGKDG